MKNQLQEMECQFKEELFEMVKIQAECNENDLFDYYNLIVANLDKHNDIIKEMLCCGLRGLDYNKDSWGYDDGEINIDLSNDVLFKIKLMKEYDDVFDVYRKSYSITKVSSVIEILEEDTNPDMLHKIQEETEEKLKEFRLKQKQDKLNRMLEERKQLNLDIEELEKELNLAS